jgi:hypothetical protein
MNLMLNVIEAMKETGGDLTINARMNSQRQLITVGTGEAFIDAPPFPRAAKNEKSRQPHRWRSPQPQPGFSIPFLLPTLLSNLTRTASSDELVRPPNVFRILKWERS